MNVNATCNAGFCPITNAITNYLKNKGASSEACLTPEVVQGLQNLELHLWDRPDGIRDHFDTLTLSNTIPMDVLFTRINEETMNTLGIQKCRTKDAKLSTTFTNEQVSERAEALSWLMDENIYLCEINNGSASKITDEMLAQHFGKIGKRIDECFAAGEITQQEYDDLNAGLEKYTEAMTVQLEEFRAEDRFRQALAGAVESMQKNGVSDWEIEAYVKEQLAGFRQHINEFIEKWSCGIDRGWLAQMVQRVRSGEDLIEPADHPGSWNVRA